jgi:hypothetical protein
MDKEAYMATEKRRIERRNVSYYIPVTEAGTARLVGVIMDISLGGFKLDSPEQIPKGRVNNFHIDLPKDIAPQSALIFTGRSKWCRPDYIDPSTYNVGYEFLNISQANAQVFQQIFEKYGSQPGDGRRNNSDDYMWR